MLITLIVASCLMSPTGQFVTQVDGFLEPSHAIWLPDGKIAVADRMADEVVILSPDGKRLGLLELLAGEECNEPTHLFVDDEGQLQVGGTPQTPPFETVELRSAGFGTKTKDGWIIPDILGHAIHHYDADGKWLGKWGTHAILPHQGEGKLHYPNAVSISPDGKQIIVCEGFEGRIQIFEIGDGTPEAPPSITNIAHFGKCIDSYGDLIVVAEPEIGDLYLLRTGLKVPIELTRFGGEGNAPHQFKWIDGVWIGDGVVKVVGDGSLKTFIFEHDPSSRFRMIPGMVKFQTMKKDKRFGGPLEVLSEGTIATASTDIDFAISEDETIRWQVDPTGEVVRAINMSDSEVILTIKGFVQPQGIAIEKDGNILVSDIGASNIKRFSPEGKLLLTFGEKGYAPEQMFKPAGLTVLDDGTIVVIDWGNHRAQFYDPDGSWKATFGRGRSWTRD